MTTQINTLNLSDVTLVEPQDLALAMQYMVDTGRGLAMLRGVTEAELREVDRALWDALSDDPAERRRRRWCASAASIEVFRARRLQRPADAHRLQPDRARGAGGGPHAPQRRPRLQPRQVRAGAGRAAEPEATPNRRLPPDQGARNSLSEWARSAITAQLVGFGLLPLCDTCSSTSRNHEASPGNARRGTRSHSSHQELRHHRRGRSDRPQDRGRHLLLPARPVGLRQDLDPAHDRRP